MDDYGSNAALGFIQGSIIGEGVAQVTNAYRRGLAVRREFMELEQDYGNLRAQYLRLRDHALDLDIAYRNKDSELALAQVEIARRNEDIARRKEDIAYAKHEIACGKHEIALRDHEIACGKHEIALRDQAIADMRITLHQTEDRLAQEKDSHACTTKAWKNLIYAFNHYRRLLQIPQSGGDAYDSAWEAWWSPDHVPPDQRSEPKK